MRLNIMKMKMKVKNRSHRYDIKRHTWHTYRIYIKRVSV